jgi:NhaA family Na+:H+ antiporter
VLIAAAAAAIICANTALAPYYRSFVDAAFSIGPTGHPLSLAVRDWFSEGLLALFFLLVGLEIRRELTVGALTNRRAAVLPLVAAVGGVIAPAVIYLAMNSGPTAAGWAFRPRPTWPSRSALWRYWAIAFRSSCASSWLRSPSSTTCSR